MKETQNDSKSKIKQIYLVLFYYDALNVSVYI